MYELAFTTEIENGMSFNGQLMMCQGLFFLFFGVCGFIYPVVWENTVAEPFETIQGTSWLMMTSFYMQFVGILFIAGGLQDSVRFTCQVCLASMFQPLAAMYLLYGNQNGSNLLPWNTIVTLGLGGPVLALVQAKCLFTFHPLGKYINGVFSKGEVREFEPAEGLR
jgi:hypothetical protein